VGDIMEEKDIIKQLKELEYGLMMLRKHLKEFLIKLMLKLKNTILNFMMLKMKKKTQVKESIQLI